MSSVHSDLEEGEIIDDSPSTLPAAKIKKLPRRYTFKDNKNRHKKGCKHAIRNQAKKLSKLKNSSGKRKVTLIPHESCPHVRYVSKCSKNNKQGNAVPPTKFSSKNHYSPSLKEKNTPIVNTMKFRSILDLSKLKSDNFRSNAVKEIESCSFPEIFSMYKAQSEKLKNSKSNLKETNPVEVQHSKSNVCPVEADKSDLKSKDAEKEESEDEEELRRIALSTCVRNVPQELTATSFSDVEIINTSMTDVPPKQTVDSFSDVEIINNFVVDVPQKQTVTPFPDIEVINTFGPQSLNNTLCTNNFPQHLNNSLCVPNYVDLMGADNNEVVDMELDEDCEKSPITSDIFIIDTQPSSEIHKNSDTASKENLSSDDDFEADILRAELIEKMYRQKSSINEVQNNNQHIKMNGVPKTSSSNVKTLPQNNKAKPIKNVKRNEVSKSPKRLIISLNAESSSEESDNASHDAVPILPENPVASIEALISDIRQKSDCNDKADRSIKVVPKSVSCLSKAQQEEYNALMKILAEKEKVLPVPKEETKKAVHSPLKDLKILQKKLLGVTETLKKKKLLLKRLSQEVAEHKRSYLKSKITVQRLKEQYIAAADAKRIKLEEWSKCSNKFQALGTSVSQLQSKTSHLKSLCSRVSSCISGLNYSLPSVSADS